MKQITMYNGEIEMLKECDKEKIYKGEKTMLREKIYEYSERKVKYRNGSEKVLPYHKTTYYLTQGGKAIAYHDTKDNVLYLNSDIINHRKDGMRERKEISIFKRALNCRLSDYFAELFIIYKIENDKGLSEYMDVYI